MSPRLKALKAEYEESAQAYLRSLPLEHFMEAKPQAMQRRITLASLTLLVKFLAGLYLFNEMLVQYRRKGQQTIEKVVPDNMVVRADSEPQADGSYDLEIERDIPFWVLEYVSKSSVRKDYEDNFARYEKDLKIPYYLVFYPDTQDLTLYHRRKGRYVSVPPNAEDRHPIPELEVEVAIHQGWVRFWFRGKLLPLPDELQDEADDLRRRLLATEAERDSARSERDSARSELDSVRKALTESITLQAAEKARADALEKRLAELQNQQARTPRTSRKNGPAE